MNTTLYMAMSVNGIIAREDYSEDFLSDEDWTLFCSIVKEYGNIIWGSNTYKQLLDWSEDHFTDEIKQATKVIISRDKNFQIKQGYTLAQTPQDALKVLEGKGYEKALLTGGSTINSLFAQQKLIDKVLLTLDPVLIGKGISLFSPSEFDLNLEFQDFKKLSNGRIMLRYTVKY